MNVQTEMATRVDDINRILSDNKDPFTIRFRKIPKSTGYIKNAFEIQNAVHGKISANPLVYEDDIKAMTDHEIVEYLEDIYKNEKLQIEEEEIGSKKYVLQHALPHLVSGSRKSFFNEHGIANISFLDMAVTFCVSVSGGFYTVSEAMVQSAGIRYDEIVAAAIKNREADYRICKMSDILGMRDIEEIPMTVVTSKSEIGVYGASIVLSQKAMKQVADRLGGSFLVLPSSVHEVICIPATLDLDIAEIRNTVREINNSDAVAPDDVLTDSVYIWKQKEGRLEIAE